MGDPENVIYLMIMIIRWVLKQHFVGHPKPEDFDLVEEELPALQDRQFRFQLKPLKKKKISISPTTNLQVSLPLPLCRPVHAALHLQVLFII